MDMEDNELERRQATVEERRITEEEYLEIKHKYDTDMHDWRSKIVRSIQLFDGNGQSMGIWRVRQVELFRDKRGCSFMSDDNRRVTVFVGGGSLVMEEKMPKEPKPVMSWFVVGDRSNGAIYLRKDKV